MHNTCGNCKNARKGSGSMVYCLLYGIFIRKDYDGCMYGKVWEPEDGYRGSAV